MLDEQGQVLGTRVLHHPHVNEQPFTRRLRLELPSGLAASAKSAEIKVKVRGHDKVHGWGGRELIVKLPKR